MDPDSKTPRLVWALLGAKHGDNTQVRALAHAVTDMTGARLVEKTLAFHPAELLIHALPASVAGLRRSARRALTPPWPDLVVTAGRRNEPVAHWIRRHSRGAARLVHLGRPWSHPARFDLVVTTPQYELTPAPGVIECRLPPTGSRDAIPPADPGPWHQIFAALPAPRTGVLVGGRSGYLLFTARDAERLAGRLNALGRAAGGSLLVTTSPRTPSAFGQILRERLEVPHHFHAWSTEGGNPYGAILAVAERFVVTSDSVSMIAEALATGKPVYVHDIEPRRRGWWLHAGEFRWRALSHRFVQRFAPRRFRRNVRRLVSALIEGGHARWFTDPFEPFEPAALDQAAEFARVAARAAALIGRPAA
jgi:uncharacterized protein